MTDRVDDQAVRVTASELRRDLRDWLERVAYREDELVVTRSGRPLAAVVSMRAYELLRRVYEKLEEQGDAAALRRIQKEGEYISLEEALRGLD